MPRAYDSQPLPFDRDPLRNILGGIPKQPPVDYAAIQQAAINWFNTMMADLFDIAAWDDAKAKWTNIINQIGALFTLVQSPVSTAQWAVWWSNTLIALGIDSTTAATVANWLSGNYDAAKTAKKNWDDFVTAIGLNPTQIAAAIQTATNNWNAFLTAMGLNPTQIAAAISASTSQWNAFLASIGLGSATAAGSQVAANQQKWVDLLASVGVGTAADVGAAQAANTARWNSFLASIGLGSATAAGAQIASSKAQTDQTAAWAKRKSQNDKILNDWSFYYPFGSPTDTATTTVGGKRTKWGAWNDNIAIITEQLGFAPPTVPLVDGASAVKAIAGNGTLGTVSPSALNDIVPAASVAGTQGIESIDQTVQGTWDSISVAVTQELGLDTVPDSGNPLSTVQDVLGQHAAQTSAALAQSATNANTIAAVAPNIAQPLITNPLPNQVATFAPLYLYTSMLSVSGQSSAQPSSISNTTFTQNAVVDSITFIGNFGASTGTQPTGFYVNLYSVDSTTGVLTQVSTTGNIISSIGTSSNPTTISQSSWITIELPTQLSVTAGTTIAAEWVCVGGSSTNTVRIAAVQINAPPYPGIYPKAPCQQRGSATGTPQPTTVASVSVANFGGWISFNGPGTVYRYPVTRKISTSDSVVAPDWAKYADIIILGGGSAGGGGIGFPGGAGSATTVAQGSNSLSAAGGAASPAANTNNSGLASGDGALKKAYDPPGVTKATTYPGSTDVAAQQIGSSPGGGGGGGNNGLGVYGYGGNCGTWNTATWTISGGETFTVTVGSGGNPASGQGVGAQRGAAGVAYLVFRAS